MTESYIPSKHQAAGHDGCMISPDSGALFIKLTNQQEIDFYNQTQLCCKEEEEDGESLLGSKLIDWFPVYMGVLTKGEMTKEDGAKENIMVMPAATDDMFIVNEEKDIEDDDKQYIVLQNLYHGFKYPSIMDIKLGSKLTDELATPEKVERMEKVSASTTSGTLHFRICGMKVYNGSSDEIPDELYAGMDNDIKLKSDINDGNYLEYSKYYGRTLTKEIIKKGILLFFTSYQTDKFIVRSLVLKFLKRLQVLYNCLMDCEVRIVSGSLLLIYENDFEKWNKVLNDEDAYDEEDPLISDPLIDEDDEVEVDDDNGDNSEKDESKAPLSSLNLIDFAHAKYVKGQGYDENVIIGIENLIAIFEDILIDLQK